MKIVLYEATSKGAEPSPQFAFIARFESVSAGKKGTLPRPELLPIEFYGATAQEAVDRAGTFMQEEWAKEAALKKRAEDRAAKAQVARLARRAA